MLNDALPSCWSGRAVWLVVCACVLTPVAGLSAQNADPEPTDVLIIESIDEPTPPAAPPPAGLAVFGLRPHETEHYVIYCNKSAAFIADIGVRLERMYDEYSVLMGRAFNPTEDKAKVFVFSDRASFVAAGGHPVMPGISKIVITNMSEEARRQSSDPDLRVGSRLMLIAPGQSVDISLDHLLRHEGWHHFASMNVTLQMPTWLDEGMGDFLGHSVWTGDGIIHGVIRPEAYASFIGYVEQNRLLTLRRLLAITNDEWLAQAGTDDGWRGYMQSWSLVHFLMTAEDGRHLSRLARYLNAAVTGRDLQAASDRIAQMQSTYKRWIESLNPTTTHPKLYQAMVAILTSHLARAHARGQWFESADQFITMARAGQLRLPPPGDEQWLPRSLMDEAFFLFDQLSGAYNPFELTLDTSAASPTLHLLDDRQNLKLTGSFELTDGKVTDVTVEYVWPEPLDLFAGREAAERRHRRENR